MRTKEEARKRNWMKSRLMGLTIDTSVLTQNELLIAQEILRHRDDILGFWDRESEKFLGHPLPPHKCHFCGKRSGKLYTYNGNVVCAKHFKIFKSEEDDLYDDIEQGLI